MPDNKRPIPLFILFIVFLVLKLTNYIDWSWWYVTMPIWAPVALFLASLVLIGVTGLLALFIAIVIIICLAIFDYFDKRRNF
jgi:hypothetical protein